MKEKSIKEIVALAQSYSKEKIPWHHHLLTLNCAFNDTNQFRIVLENEQSRESFFTNFDHKPMKELELFDNMFFNRIKL